MKKVDITHAEVIPFYGSQEVLKEIPIKDKGTILSFNVKTRINDLKSNSPIIFDKCDYFSNSDKEIKRIREVVQLGSILDIKGTHDRRSSTGKDGKKKYYDSIKIDEIKPIQIASVQKEEEEELPF